MAQRHMASGGCVGERVRMTRGAHTVANAFAKKGSGVGDERLRSFHEVSPSSLPSSDQQRKGSRQSSARAARRSGFEVQFMRPTTDRKERIGKLITFLDTAEKSIDIAMYALSEKSTMKDDLVAAIVSKFRQGVIVRVITDKKYNACWNALQKHGVQVCSSVDARCEMHHKFAVVDNSSVVTGSFNWTGARFYDNVVFCQHPQLAQAFSGEFHRLWDAFMQGRDPAEATLLQAFSACRLLRFPEDTRGNSGNNFNELKAVVESATHSLEVCVFTLTSYSSRSGECLTDVVCRIANQGVSVRVVIDRYQALSTQFSRQAVEQLKSIGVPLRQQSGGNRMHHKFCVVDKRIVCTGSLNWTQKAHRSNQENCVIFHDKHLAASYSEELEIIWQEGIQA